MSNTGLLVSQMLVYFGVVRVGCISKIERVYHVTGDGLCACCIVGGE